MPDIGRDPAGDGSSATALVNAIANQSDLAAVTLGLSASATPSAYSWAVNGATTGLSSSTASAPTFTPTQPGQHTVTCTATIGGGPVIAEPHTFLVGDGLLPIREGATGTVVDTL